MRRSAPPPFRLGLGVGAADHTQDVVGVDAPPQPLPGPPTAPNVN